MQTSFRSLTSRPVGPRSNMRVRSIGDQQQVRTTQSISSASWHVILVPGHLNHTLFICLAPRSLLTTAHLIHRSPLCKPPFPPCCWLSSSNPKRWLQRPVYRTSRWGADDDEDGDTICRSVRTVKYHLLITTITVAACHILNHVPTSLPTWPLQVLNPTTDAINGR